ncbi:UNVERIFIED_CONTAM: hypothetical protein FKN15_056967 [Acipenser sinensis]
MDTHQMERALSAVNFFFHSAGLPCSHLRATVSEDNAGLGKQAGPQVPGQSTGVTGMLLPEDTLADLSPPSPGRRLANCVLPPGSSRPRSAME